MNAVQIAHDKAKKRRDAEKAAEKAREDHYTHIKEEGKRLYKVVRKVIDEFREDLKITKIPNQYAWKLVLPEMWGQRDRPKEIFVVLDYYTRMVKYSDDTDSQEVSSWIVTVEIVGPRWQTGYMRDGRFNNVLQMSTVQDFYCSDLEGDFERDFGQYMARWF